MMDQTSTNLPDIVPITQSLEIINIDPTSTNNSQQQHIDVQLKQFIQKQLVLLLHAYKCQQGEKNTIHGEAAHPSACTLPHCSTMKNVLQHMTNCNDYKTCTFTHCVTSRQIIFHWKKCNNSQCSICQPLKTPPTLDKLNQTPNNNNNNNPTTTTSITMNKEWQRCITQEMRHHLVQKIITTLTPITDTGTMDDERIIKLANYARRIESETYETANNQEEYFHILAEKNYKTQKELEDL